MADEFDLLNLEPSKIDRTLKGKYILIYGPYKSGKSTFASKFPRSLFLKFEEGTHALGGIKGVPIFKWASLKKYLLQLRKPEVRAAYDTIVVDTCSIAWQLCESYICSREDVNQIREIPYGNGFTMLKREFSEIWREISLLGYGIVFITHDKTFDTGEQDDDGNPIIEIKPDLPVSCAAIINAEVDIIAYLKVIMQKDGHADRKLITRATPHVFAGSRYRYLKEEIPFDENGYQELISAIGDAIDMDVELNGVEVTDVHEEIKEAISRPFSKVMEEAKELWCEYIDGAGDDDEAREYRLNVLNSIIAKNFGKQMKLSAALPSQQDIVEIVVSEIKELKNN